MILLTVSLILAAPEILVVTGTTGVAIDGNQVYHTLQVDAHGRADKDGTWKVEVVGDHPPMLVDHGVIKPFDGVFALHTDGKWGYVPIGKPLPLRVRVTVTTPDGVDVQEIDVPPPDVGPGRSHNGKVLWTSLGKEESRDLIRKTNRK